MRTVYFVSALACTAWAAESWHADVLAGVPWSADTRIYVVGALALWLTFAIWREPRRSDEA